MGVFKEMTKCLSFDSYILFRGDSVGKNFRYMLLMSFICWLLTVVIGWGVPYLTTGRELLAEIPEFSMSSEGILTAEDTIDEAEDDVRIVLNTDYDFIYDEENDAVYRSANGISELLFNGYDYSQYFVLGSTGLILCDDTGDVLEFDYSDIPNEYRTRINSESFVEFIKSVILVLGGLAFIFIFIRLALWNFVNTCIAAIISSIKGVQNTFGQLYSISLRAYTPMYLIACIVGAIPGIAIPFKTILGLVLTGVILHKALKAIKAQTGEAAQASVGDMDMYSIDENNQ